MKILNFKKKQSAFTLAEVLIVIGIIGIIAETTIPTLVNNVHEMQYKVAAKKAFSVANSAITQMNQDNGTTNSDYFKSPYMFYPAFVKYFKLSKDCGWDSGCLNKWAADTHLSKDYKNLAGGNVNSSLLDDGQFITADGMLFMIENYMSPIYITVDVNGPYKKPNVLGEDTFTFQLLPNKLAPMGANGTDYPAVTYCDRKNNITQQGFGCMSLVSQGIEY